MFEMFFFHMEQTQTGCEPCAQCIILYIEHYTVCTHTRLARVLYYNGVDADTLGAVVHGLQRRDVIDFLDAQGTRNVFRRFPTPPTQPPAPGMTIRAAPCDV